MKIANWSKFLNRKNKEAVLKNRNMWDFFGMQNRPKNVFMVVIPPGRSCGNCLQFYPFFLKDSVPYMQMRIRPHTSNVNSPGICPCLRFCEGGGGGGGAAVCSFLTRALLSASGTFYQKSFLTQIIIYVCFSCFESLCLCSSSGFSLSLLSQSPSSTHHYHRHHHIIIIVTIIASS